MKANKRNNKEYSRKLLTWTAYLHIRNHGPGYFELIQNYLNCFPTNRLARWTKNVKEEEKRRPDWPAAFLSIFD